MSLQLLRDTISSGLKKRSIVSCSDWAMKYRIMGKPFPGKFSFKYHPWLKEMHDCEDPMWIGMKAAQLGYTEAVLNKGFYYVDIKRVDVLYVLPSKTPDASDFSAARFDAALDLSPHLSALFQDVKNVGHKRAGNVNFYIRGSHSKSSLKSIPAGLIILDEVEEMTADNVRLALERQSGQIDRNAALISTPRIPHKGIHSFYLDSTQEHFYFPCPHCSRYTELTFPDCLIITADDSSDPKVNDSYLICKECKHPLSHETKPDWLSLDRGAHWVPTFTNKNVRGFHVNQLYSCAEKPGNIAKLYLKAQVDNSAEQEFYNSKLGLVHEVEGARVTDDQINNCIGHYTSDSMPTSYDNLITMGVDQGKHLHIEIAEWRYNPLSSSVDINDLHRPRILKIQSLLDFDELDELMYHYHIHSVIIDAQPEKRMAMQFANRWPGFVRLCYYGEGVKGKTINEWTNEPAVTVDRTSWMDLALGRLKASQMTLPKDFPLDYRHHVKAPVRTYRQDRYGVTVAIYECGDNVADHYAHARTYNEIALTFAAQLMKSRTMKSPR